MAQSRVRRTAAAKVIAVAAAVALALGGFVGTAAAGGKDHSHHHGHKDRDHHDRGHGKDRERVELSVTIHGSSAVVTSDTTPTVSGQVTPAKGISVEAYVTGEGGGAPCAGMAVSGSGSWSCTVSEELAPGDYHVKVRATAKCGKDDWAKTSAKQRLTIEVPEEPAEEPTEEPVEEPTEEPVEEPTEEPTEDPVEQPKPQPKPKPEPRVAAAPASDRPTVTEVEEPALKKLNWAFRVVDANGNDITGSPVRMGDRVSIGASELPAGAKISLEIHSTPMALGVGTAGADGTLTLAVTVPTTLEAGAHMLVATLTAAGYEPAVASVPVHVNEALELSGELDAEPIPEPPAIEAVTPEPAADLDSRGFDDEHAGIADELQSIFDITAEPWKFAATGSLAAALVLLAALPAELLQSTLSENYGRAFGWLEPTRRRIARVGARSQGRFAVNPWLGGTFTVPVAAFILGFAQPGYGFNSASIMQFAALFLSLFLLNIAVNAVRMGVAWRRLRLPGRLIPMPGALIVAAISVIVSRWLDLNPALLFGLVIGVRFARATSRAVSGKLALVAVSSVLALGIGSWLLFGLLVSATGSSESWPVELLEETLAAASFVFIAVPLGESWEDARAPLATWLSLLAGFTMISVSAWALFHFIPAHDNAREREHASR